MAIDVTQLLDEILGGEHDTELADIYTAIVGRNEERSYSMTWRLNVPHPSVQGENLIVAEHDLTIAEWMTAEELAGRTWVSIEPRRSSSCMRALLVAVYQHRCAMSRSDAEAKVGALSGVEMLDAVQPVEVARRPLSAGR